MLTSSANQYLRPEYLTPLPTTLDAKKSPLALLAQTCSQIGADMPSGKSMPTSGDKSKSSKSSSDSSSRDKSSPLTHNHSSSASSTASTDSVTKSSSSFKPYESCVTREKTTSSPDQQRVPSAPSSGSRSRTPGNSKRCGSNQSASSSGGREMTPHGRKSATPGNGDIATARESPCLAPAASSPSSKPAFSPAVLTSQELSLGSSFRPSLATSSGANTTTTPSAAAYGLPFPPQMPHMDAMAASSLMSQHLKAGMHPYLSYARMKTPSGADTLVPVCRDPYCTGCQLNSHLLTGGAASPPVNGAKPPTSSAGPCPAGCAQCDHKSSPSAAAAAAAAAGPYAAYHAQLVALAAASQMPYVCNWIGADAAYCGKRFGTSDELLSHFRNHTSGQESSAAATAAALSLLSPPGLGPGHPLLSRTYPTPPLSPLATARYHPYGKPYGPPHLSTLGLPLPPPPHPAAAGLPPYFSPYASLYAGSRLGAASGMHQ